MGISIQKLSKTYVRGSSSTQVLNNLELEISQGEFIALMGPSGSGKTTILNIIAGLDKPDVNPETVLSVFNNKLLELTERELTEWRSKNVGFIFQFYNLIPVLSAIDNVMLPLTLFNISESERIERAKFALDLVGLQERASHRPTQLSGGQEQRVAIARAIVTDPKFIVADEPTGDLDSRSASDVMELLKQLNSEFGKTILMVTHDQNTANYATRTIRTNKGEINLAQMNFG